MMTSILPVLSSLFSVPSPLLTTLPEIFKIVSGFAFSNVLKFLFLFSITHCVIP